MTPTPNKKLLDKTDRRYGQHPIGTCGAWESSDMDTSLLTNGNRMPSCVGGKRSSCVVLSTADMLRIKWHMRSKTDNDSNAFECDNRSLIWGGVVPNSEPLPPAFSGQAHQTSQDVRWLMQQAVQGWLSKTPSAATRENYARDLSQFLDFQDPPSSTRRIDVGAAARRSSREALRLARCRRYQR